MSTTIFAVHRLLRLLKFRTPPKSQLSLSCATMANTTFEPRCRRRGLHDRRTKGPGLLLGGPCRAERRLACWQRRKKKPVRKPTHPPRRTRVPATNRRILLAHRPNRTLYSKRTTQRLSLLPHRPNQNHPSCRRAFLNHTSHRKRRHIHHPVKSQH